jgi:hypothetical protein
MEPIFVLDYSIVSLSGASQELLPQTANLNRRFLMIQNTGNANIGVNLVGGTAEIGGTGTFTLVPNGSITLSNGFCPSNKINIVGTSGQPVACVSDP